MNCDEAQELLGLIWDMPENDPRRKRFEWHLLGCEACAFEYEIWKETEQHIHNLQIDSIPEHTERINRNVMDRIYAESPWLAPVSPQSSKLAYRQKHRLALWVAGFLAIFLCSSLFFLWPIQSKPQAKEQIVSGLVPTAIAGGESGNTSTVSYNLSSLSKGIVDPFVVKMNPAYPQYWMIFSIVGMGLALFSWTGLRRIKR
ncbi:hypothetical protein J2Z69_000574 [Paenibacillus shirakamiensis]|uniref:Zinc-finger domain-containing protein n=1 Tax=Paenibacillus shirakamiensis TaxID=1265935 RepID=A0ABS4JEQ1_9BACL|nr:zf-HC2 domain-containing protein [Paenibacillus shirakamiensis]MBP1999555.1 hypothetical protein [Paenibacillus shirakamiensis]